MNHRSGLSRNLLGSALFVLGCAAWSSCPPHGGGGSGSTGGGSESGGGGQSASAGETSSSGGDAGGGGAGGAGGSAGAGGAGGSGPEPDGRTCDSPFVLTGDNPVAQADSCQFGADITIWIGCSGHDLTASPDAVYVFTPSASGLYTIELDTTATGWDPVLTVGPVCGDPGSNGDWCADAAGPNELLEYMAFEAGIPYFIVVDGWASDVTHIPSCGPFTLSVTRVD
jgi:hypothetical protein